MALAALDLGEGLVKVTGEVGTGKTLLCRQLLASLSQDKFYTAFIPNPYLSPSELRLSLAHELGLEISRSQPEKVLLETLYNRLYELAKQNLSVVLVVDEAQAMQTETLEALRLLTNLETEESKLMQVILFGQPELDVRLNQYNMRQLKQRITFSGHIAPLNSEETQQYIHHRLSQAEYNGDLLFSPEACRIIFKNTGGIPRLINIICHKSMMLAYGQNVRSISRKLALKAIIDTDSTKPRGLSLMARRFSAS
jgi:MSHA biogenesis protein MshM